MRNYFTNKNTKERRLIGFAPKPAPRPVDPEHSPDGVADDAGKVELKNLEEKLKVFDTKSVDGAEAQKTIEGLVEAAATDTRESENESAEAVRAGLLKAAESSFRDQVGKDKSPENIKIALKEVNSDFAPLGIQFTADELLHLSIAPDALPPMTKDEEALAKAMRQLGLKDPGGEEFARGMTAIANALKALRKIFGLDKKKPGADGSTPEGDKKKPEGDKKKPEGEKKKPEGDPTTPKGGADTGPGARKSDKLREGGETLAVSEVENPKTEAEKVKAELEGLRTKEGKLEGKLEELGKKLDGKTDKKERKKILGKMEKISKKLGKIEDKIKAKEAEVTALEKELARRAKVIEEAWGRAGPKKGFVKGVTLNVKDGNDIVITLADGIAVADLTDEQKKQFAIAGVTVEGDTLVIKDAPAGMFAEAGKAGLDTIMQSLAGITGPEKKSEGGGDLTGGAEKKEDKEASPEAIEFAEKLNAQLDLLLLSNKKFMGETPIGKVFTNMRYKAVGNEIMLNVPQEGAAQLRDIMKANGRKVSGSAEKGYKIEGYPDGSTVDMPAEGAADYPSRLAWGGAEGDAKSQFGRAESGMNKWSKIVSKTPPEGTEKVKAETNDKLNVTAAKSPGAQAIDTALTKIQNKLGKAAGDTVFGQFINKLKVGNNGEDIALTSTADADVFSHIYKELGMSALIKGGVEKDADGKYVMNIDEKNAGNIVDNLKRWSAFLGSKVEGGSADLGPEAGKGKEPKPEEVKPKPEDVESPDDKFNQAIEKYNSMVTELGEDAHFSSRDGAHPLDAPHVVRQLSELTDFVNSIDIPEGRNKFELRLRRLVPPWEKGSQKYFIEFDTDKEKMVITPPKEEAKSKPDDGTERLEEIGKELEGQFTEITIILDSAGFDEGGVELEAVLAKINELHKEAGHDYRPEITEQEFHDQGADKWYHLVENGDSKYELKPVKPEEKEEVSETLDQMKERVEKNLALGKDVLKQLDEGTMTIEGPPDLKYVQDIIDSLNQGVTDLMPLAGEGEMIEGLSQELAAVAGKLEAHLEPKEKKA